MVYIPSIQTPMLLDEVLDMCNNLCERCYQYFENENFSGLHEILRELMDLHYACPGSKSIICNRLISLHFDVFAVKTMIHLNNTRVFRNNDTWFTTFYFYNICWSYSESHAKFSSQLVLSNIDKVLLCNITHQGYVENLEKTNIYYLVKSSVAILHNLLRHPGHRSRFCTELVINSLVVLTKKDEVVGHLATICLGFIATNENVVNSSSFNILDNLKVVYDYLLKFMKEYDINAKICRMIELVEFFKANAICKLQRKAIIDFGCLDTFITCLTVSNDITVKVNCLWILASICDINNTEKIRSCAKEYVSHESKEVQNVAKSVLWRLNVLGNNEKEKRSGDAVFVNFSEMDIDAATQIYDHLENCNRLPLKSYENDSELLKEAYDSSSIIILCFSENFKNAGNFMTGTKYCLQQKKTIFPFIVDKNYGMDGWIKELSDQCSDICYHLTNNKEEWAVFSRDLRDQLIYGEDIFEKRVKIDKSNVDENTIILSDDDESDKDTNEESSNGEDIFSVWLSKNDLSHLQTKLSAFSMEMLISLKKIRNDVPQYYFESLGTHLGMSFTEVLQFDAALSSL